MVEHLPSPPVEEAPRRSFPEYVQEAAETGDVHAGSPLPMGVLLRDGGINFALFSRHATRIWLELYDRPRTDVRPPHRAHVEAAPHRRHWTDGDRKTLGFLIHNQPERPGLLPLFNAEADTYLHVRAAAPTGGGSLGAQVDTAREAPEDVLEAGGEVLLEASYYAR